MPETNDIDLLMQLLARCHCEVSVLVNAHRNYYESAAQYLDRYEGNDDDDASVRAEMIARDTIVEVQAYPTTPVGFYVARHWDVTTALRAVLDAVTAESA